MLGNLFIDRIRLYVDGHDYCVLVESLMRIWEGKYQTWSVIPSTKTSLHLKGKFVIIDLNIFVTAIGSHNVMTVNDTNKS